MTTIAAIVPSSAQPIVGPGGRVTTVWQRFFNALVRPADPIVAVTPTGSPFAYMAGAGGNLYVVGGTVSAITLKRSTTTVTVTSPVPVANGDTVTVTYSGAPTITFVPF